MLNNHSRADGRLLAQFRKTTVQQGILSKHASGSALVTFRDDNCQEESTSILAAVTLQVGQPRCTSTFPAGRGDIDVTVTSFKEDDSINVSVLQSYLQRILDVCVQEAQEDCSVTDGEKNYHPLLLIPAKAAIGLVVTVKILQNAGNVGDASLLACIAALLDTRIPCREHGISLEEKTGRIWWQPKCYDSERNEPHKTAKGCRCLERGETQYQMKFPILPLPVTIGLYCSETTEGVDNKRRNWLVDPSTPEESSLSTIFTMVVNAHAPEQILLFDFCPSSGENDGNCSIRTKDLALVSQIAKARAEELKRIVVNTE